MKKLLAIVLAVALTVPCFAAEVEFEAGKDNPEIFIPRYVNSYIKDWVLVVPINAELEPTVDTAAANFAGRVRSFMVPEAAELMKAWICSSDSTLDSFRLRLNIFSNDTSSTDTAAYYGTSAKGIKKKMSYNVPDTFKRTSTINKRQWDAGEMGYIRVDTTGSTAVLPTQIPTGMKVYMLFRPKSSPSYKNSDYYTR